MVVETGVEEAPLSRSPSNSERREKREERERKREERETVFTSKVPVQGKEVNSGLTFIDLNKWRRRREEREREKRSMMWRN